MSAGPALVGHPADPTSGAAGRPLVRLTTGLLDTVVVAADLAVPGDPAPAVYDWTRRCGTAAPDPFNRVPPTMRTALAARPGPVRWVAGTGGPWVRHYRVGGAVSLAATLLGDRSAPALPALLTGLGRAVRDLQAMPRPSAAELDQPRGLRRLRRWLDGRSPDLAAARAAGLVRDRIGAAAWRRLRDRLAALDDTGDPVPAHGMLGLGSVVPAGVPSRQPVSPAAPRPADAGVLIGEDLTLAPAAWDVGCVLAELIEDRWRGSDPQFTAAAVAAFERGLDRRLDAACSSAAILRIALHLHDYVAYVAFDPTETLRYADLLGSLLTRFPLPDAERETAG